MEELEMCLMWVSKDILIEQNAKWYQGQVNVTQQRHMSVESVPKVLWTQKCSVFS